MQRLSFLLVTGTALALNPSDQAKKLVQQMTLDEKVQMLHGAGGPYIGNVAGNDRLGIPPLNLNDGPQGFRARGHAGTSTQFPCTLAVGATWDPNISYEFGAAMGQEFLDKGSNVLLGPGMCIARIPRCGRNFEYVSGEDPVLGVKMVPGIVTGIQDQGVIANAKHWINNNQETARMSENNEVDMRTQREIYLPPFEAAVKAGVGSFMCSYNKINGNWSCENPQMLSILKEDFGFEGWVMSDWGATHSLSIEAGLDQEMPGKHYFGDTLKNAVTSGSISNETIDDSVIRVLTPMIQMGLLNRTAPSADDINKNVTSDEHNALCRKIAAESTILLKNDHQILPLLPPWNKLKMAIVGTTAHSRTKTAGSGSGHVSGPYVISPFDGISSHRMGQAYDIFLVDTDSADDAKKQVEGADIAIVVVGCISTEGADRDSLSLDGGQDDLISAVAATVGSGKTIVVASVPGAILTPWRDEVAAIIMNFFPGQEAGNALADVIFGDASPGGRLTLTLPNSENEMKMTESQYPGVDGVSTYSEKLLVGYRWYIHNGVQPAYPFGHGLSYTTWKYDNIVAKDTSILFNITNTGLYSGSEVAQLYLQFPPGYQEPAMQLKGFQKVRLNVGESQSVTIDLEDRDFSFYDDEKSAWMPASGHFRVFVGSSIDSLYLQTTVTRK